MTDRIQPIAAARTAARNGGAAEAAVSARVADGRVSALRGGRNSHDAADHPRQVTR